MSSSLARLALLLVVLAVAAVAAFATASPTPAATPSLIWRATMTDAESGQAIAATILVDGAVIVSGVSQADVPIVVDAQLHHLRVIADGYQTWAIVLRGVTKDGRVLQGPVRLVPLPTQRAYIDVARMTYALGVTRPIYRSPHPANQPARYQRWANRSAL